MSLNPTYREIFKIRFNESGPNLKMTLPAVAGFLQEAAWMHSMELQVSVFDLFRKGYTWVLSRLTINLEDFVRHKEKLSVVTWPSGYERQNIFRGYHLFDCEGRKIGAAGSEWAIMDLKSRQPIYPPPFITEIYDRLELPEVHSRLEKVPEAASYAYANQFKAKWHDIDINQHVNHISFIKWTIESVPSDVLMNKEAVSIDIAFRSECKYGDEIIAYSQPVDSSSSTFLHKLESSKNNRALILAKTHWR